jgi:hypothetical protein
MLVVDQQFRIANNVDEQDVTDLEFENWLTFSRHTNRHRRRFRDGNPLRV